MKKLLILLMFSLSTPSFAVGIGNDNPHGGNSTNLINASAQQAQMQAQRQAQGQAQLTNVEVSNRISNDVRNNAASFAAGGTAVAGGGQGGTAISGGGQGGVGQAVSGGSQSGVDFSITSPKNTPSVFAGNIYPTAPCSGSTTVGGSGVGFGISVGTSWKDDDCSLRETARSFHQMGLGADAIRILCTSTYASNAPSCAAEVEARKAKE